MKPIEEPVRWLDARSDTPEDVRQLLARGRDALGPTPAELARLTASVAMAAGGAAAAGAGAGAAKVAAAHGGHALTTGVVKLVAVLAVVGAGGGIGWTVLRPTPAAPTAPTAAATRGSSVEVPVATTTSAPVAPPVAPPAAPPDETVPSSVTSPPPRGTGGVVTSAPRAAPVVPSEVPTTAPTATTATSESELALLDRARTRMAADPTGALRALDEHRARYPQGVFVQEREVLAIEALVRQGRRPEAEARAAAFEKEFPGSAHHRRIKVLLGSQGQ